MKSPWKMIGQLIFRSRSPEEPQELISEDIARQAHVPDEQETSSSSLSPVRPLLEPQREDVELVGKTALEDAKSDGGTRLPTPVTVDHIATRSTKKSNRVRAQTSKKETRGEIASTPPAARPRRGGQQASTAPVKQKVEAAGNRETSTRPGRDNIHAEVADVDAEIRALARQLAEKLKQQNAQLHKMLERFGGSDT